MMELQPNETTITGSWLIDNGNVVADDVCHRIDWLIKSQLEHLATDSSGWNKLYRDRKDNRLWECIYSQGELHGGGPRQLRLVSREEALANYNITY